jgi:NCS1 family nucleobase:cation symporter-1
MLNRPISLLSKVAPKSWYMYVPVLPVSFTFVSFIGIAARSAGGARYGKLEWGPMALVSHWSSCVCKFFAAFSLALVALTGCQYFGQLALRC